MAPRVVVLGAGLAGLSTSLHLPPEADVRVFEREDEVGGVARSRRVGEFTFDYTGHLLHLRDAGVKELVARLLPDAFASCERHAVIHSHGVKVPYPFQANLHGLPKEVVAECLTGFVEGCARLENTSPSSGSDVKLTLASSLKLTRPGDAAPLVVATPIVINNFAASPFDGVVDFAGSSGATLAAISGSKFNKFDYNSDADKTLFTGLGSITLPLSAVGTSRANGGASTISFFDTRTRGEVTVTYNYHAVPEPRVYGALGAMLCAGFALLRQRRSKKS